MLGLQTPSSGNAVQGRHEDVDQDDIWGEDTCLPERVVAVDRLADDGDVGIPAQDETEPFAYDPVVIDDQHTDGHAVVSAAVIGKTSCTHTCAREATERMARYAKWLHTKLGRATKPGQLHIGFALDSAAGARLARLPGMTTIGTMVLHLIRATPCPAMGHPRILGRLA